MSDDSELTKFRDALVREVMHRQTIEAEAGRMIAELKAALREWESRDQERRNYEYSRQRCMDCKSAIWGTAYGAGSGAGRDFRCGECHWKREYEALRQEHGFCRPATT